MAPTPMMRLKVSVRIRGHAITAQLAVGAAMFGACSVLAVAPAEAAERFAEAWVEWPATDRLEPLARAGALLVEGRRRVAPDRVEVRVLLPAGAEEALRARGYAVRIERDDHRLGPPPEGYHDPDEGSAVLTSLASRSERARLVRLGTSVQGRSIEALVLGRDPSEAAPEYRILGAHHGDEPSSSELALAVAEALVDRDGTEARATRILDRSTVWVVPFVNPDGIVAGDRYNAHQVDLNRNYDWGWTAAERQGGPAPFSEPETRAVRALGLHSRPVAGLSLHSGAVNLGWVWNSTTEPTVEADLLEYLAGRYAEACTAPDFWITNGAEWYLSFGDTNDWSYGRYGVPDYTLELTDPKAPPDDEIDAFVTAHLDAVLTFLDQPPTLSGRVVSDDGQPLEARLELQGPYPTAGFWSDPVTGRFHRIAGPGAATLRVSAPGYSSAEVAVDPLGADSEDVEVVLREEALGRGWAEPSVLRAAGAVRLPSAVSGPVTLSRAGADPVVVQAADGVVHLDPAELGPGWWTATDAGGKTWPRVLWVDEAEETRVRGWSLDGDALRVEGRRLGPGTRAWAVTSKDRALVELPVLEEAADHLLLDVRGLPSDRRVDVGLWSRGAHIGLEDAMNPSSGIVVEDLRVATGCASTATPASIPLLALLAVRRRRK